MAAILMIIHALQMINKSNSELILVIQVQLS